MLKKQKTLMQGSVPTAQFIQTTVLMTGSTASKVSLAKANSFEVIGGVADVEVEMLSRIKPGDRSFKVQTWLVRL